MRGTRGLVRGVGAGDQEIQEGSSSRGLGDR